MPPATSSAFGYALKLLSYRGRSEKELSSRLRQKGYIEIDISACIDRLKSLGYLNDAALAESLKRRSADIKHFGRLGARNYLREMGIPRDIIDETMGEYDELSAAREFVRKKLKAVKDPASAKRRIASALQRRGFSSGMVRKAFEE